MVRLNETGCELDASVLGSVFPSYLFPRDGSQIILSVESKSNHISSCSTKVLHLIHTVIDPVLSFIIINKFLSNGIFPKSLKIVRVIQMWLGVGYQ